MLGARAASSHALACSPTMSRRNARRGWPRLAMANNLSPQPTRRCLQAHARTHARTQAHTRTRVGDCSIARRYDGCSLSQAGGVVVNPDLVASV